MEWMFLSKKKTNKKKTKRGEQRGEMGLIWSNLFLGSNGEMVQSTQPKSSTLAHDKQAQNCDRKHTHAERRELTSVRKLRGAATPSRQTWMGRCFSEPRICVLVHELPKKGKDLKLCDAYRDIALACEAGKVYHSILRTRLVPEYWSFCSQTQYGGVRHRGCDFGNLAGRSFMMIAKARGWSCAVVFFDAVTAFASMLRALVCSTVETSFKATTKNDRKSQRHLDQATANKADQAASTATAGKLQAASSTRPANPYDVFQSRAAQRTSGAL